MKYKLKTITFTGTITETVEIPKDSHMNKLLDTLTLIGIEWVLRDHDEDNEYYQVNAKDNFGNEFYIAFTIDSFMLVDPEMT